MQMLWFLWQLIYVILYNQNVSECSEDKGFISGGEIYDPLKYPFVVGIQIRKPRYQISICTGSLISSVFVLTAAHCTYRSSAYDLKVFRSHHIFFKLSSYHEIFRFIMVI